MIDAVLGALFEAVGEAVLWLSSRVAGWLFDLNAVDARRVGEWVVLVSFVVMLFLLTVVAPLRRSVPSASGRWSGLAPAGE
ncbi:hypothetical protein [Denitromonas halophila]|uniref:Uncharacterized protein n=1 Tax=Denitromonas halophila TaxID=1629404 RepID=A0A557R0M8_9RHOO|nr:hypothetical protein [Denitromonas halophila]TVO58713.1 hypothetical protein FHP91_03350 [Denitromonas halophila]